jgi:hypothetical protein
MGILLFIRGVDGSSSLVLYFHPVSGTPTEHIPSSTPFHYRVYMGKARNLNFCSNRPATMLRLSSLTTLELKCKQSTARNLFPFVSLTGDLYFGLVQCAQADSSPPEKGYLFQTHFLLAPVYWYTSRR